MLEPINIAHIAAIAFSIIGVGGVDFGNRCKKENFLGFTEYYTCPGPGDPSSYRFCCGDKYGARCCERFMGIFDAKDVDHFIDKNKSIKEVERDLPPVDLHRIKRGISKVKKFPKLIGTYIAVAVFIFLGLVVAVILCCCFCSCCFLNKIRRRRQARNSQGGGSYCQQSAGAQMYPIQVNPQQTPNPPYSSPPPNPTYPTYPAYPTQYPSNPPPYSEVQKQPPYNPNYYPGA
ncbi:unnamed protein product [Darwinula stevensoni]|uniref:Uncharacterized protein n=1 Tax=Darwinula stevensoni TaxID=69355 RepID=A0A7R9A947_9CRUS|nr:unnamed protein product [Darwinula stevensoni]CAG0897030.1 unnamed protein product [Darwinula stevensoni]